ncbi:MAG: TIGR01777 family protein [Pseudobdellovibrionaceae bacterium]|nr:TIGR01777 family oxidoreductase [Bdellovibrionales bacterium]USN48415.1 MAG: TIGR01777 family protein [Pseudobdellovibrionaceae bacterium]
MRVLMTGATGFLGRRIAYYLLKNGHSLVVLTRSSKNFSDRFDLPCEVHEWAGQGPLPEAAVQNVEAVIHLAGEPVADKRWSEKVKSEIHQSRVQGTKDLIQSLKAFSVEPKAFVSASAIGFYGDRGDEILAEETARGDGFLSEVCEAWEGEVERGFTQTSTRWVSVRIGVVLGHGGGALTQLDPLARNQVLGALGSGKQWISWVHLDDVARLFVFAMENSDVRGVINGVAPHPVSNLDFTKALNARFNSWTFLPVPQMMLRFLKGEMANVLLGSQRCAPEKALLAGFDFRYSSLEEALSELYPHDGAQVLEFQQWVNKTRETVFPFFADENNLQTITPPNLSFHVIGKSTSAIEEGTLIDYRLKIHGVPARWQSVISQWQPEDRFVDEQTKGPYRFWHHTHSFEDLAGGTLLVDRVSFKVPLGYLGQLGASSFVRSDVKNIFSYRRKKIRELFGLNK